MTSREQYDAYLVYLRMKIEQKDWHGVADAAMDLRELEASFPELKRDREAPLSNKAGFSADAPAMLLSKVPTR